MIIRRGKPPAGTPLASWLKPRKIMLRGVQHIRLALVTQISSTPSLRNIIKEELIRSSSENRDKTRYGKVYNLHKPLLLAPYEDKTAYATKYGPASRFFLPTSKKVPMKPVLTGLSSTPKICKGYQIRIKSWNISLILLLIS